MKRIAFLIVATLMVLGFVLPGCAGGGPANVIKIAVAGPMTDLQGQNHWDGAVMAVEEINNAGGINIAGTNYTVELVKVETKESTEGEDGSYGTSKLNAVIGDVAFVVGGFRTEVVTVYREVAMTAKKIFMNCGAATGCLQWSVITDYDKYKYWFKSTPYNETFLVKSCLKMTATVGSVLKQTLVNLETVPGAVKDEFKVSNAVGGKLRVEILMENASWCAGMVTAAQYYLPLLGYNVTGTTLVSPTATDISSELAAIKGRNPHIIFTAFSGSVGAVYSIQKNSLGIPAITIGINVPGQQLSHWVNTAGKCEGEIMLDTWAWNLSNTDGTVEWFNRFVDRTGRYPVYTAGTYDAIKFVCKAIDETNSLNSDTLVAWMEDPDNIYTESIASPKVGQYPMPAIQISADGGAGCPNCNPSSGQPIYALNESQVRTFYDLDSYEWAYNVSHWIAGFPISGPTCVQQPHIAHDLIYGPGYATGIGSQWQLVSGTARKVGIWPKQVYPPTTPIATLKAAGLVDQYGNWNFQYDGTMKIILTIGGMLNISWDPYANAF